MAADLPQLTDEQRKAWSAGDFAAFAPQLLEPSEQLCESVAARAGQLVLDVGTGSGNTALAAARRGCRAAGLDFVRPLLARARERSAAEGLGLQLVEGDAQALPFPDETFDAVVSVFGAMFAPDQERTASELLRVCKRGGAIGVTSFPPSGFAGELFRITARFAPPTRGAQPVFRWGTRDGLERLFGDGAVSVDVRTRHFRLRFLSNQQGAEVFRTAFGPIGMVFSKIGQGRQARLEEALTEHVARYNEAGGGSAVVPVEYLEVIVRKG
ncbi:MAG: class I SAM-dependent methyltransferase [Actinobacteria bacterium]|nr:MAG: class I SAM-dependent methyltransferase [Actinomycetota bacterium]